jgi:cyclic beta-1,2-glucan synthetase
MHGDDFKIFEEPIRSEIFSTTRLEIHGESLARAQKAVATGRGKNLTSRVKDNGRVLEKSYKFLLQAVEENRAITPAAEWLIDNFHIVRAQLKDIHDHLPPKFYRELPKLTEGPLAGLPRVYGIAWAFVAHTDSRFDPELLRRFLISYQSVQVLTIGELWAISITLRVVMMENLRRLSARIVGSQIGRREADNLADELLGLSESASRSPESVIKSLVAKPLLLNAFAVQLLQRLRFQDPHVEPVLHWLERKLAEKHIGPDEVAATEHQSQMAANATVRNIITSSRLMSAFNWQDFFEEVSPVDKILQTYPLYPKMDFTTRNRYRHSLEELAKHCALTEIEVAQKIVAKNADPGFYLLAKGRREIEKETNYKPPLAFRTLSLYTRYATRFYLGSILALTLLILSWPLSENNYWLLALFGLFPASEIAMALINRVTIGLLGPRHLPRLSLEEGIHDEARTFVVVPTMFGREHEIERQVDDLEIHYLSNPEKNLYFALLSDYLDSPTEFRENDKRILDIAARRVSKLNAKYPTADGTDRFYVYHRKRLYNPQEGKWMGWERKRGKLEEFNRLLLGEEKHSFIDLPGKNLSTPKGIRYIITLDSDTRLPNGAALQLIGTMAHPLNKPVYEPTLGRVTDGYGILQPRITPTLPSESDSTLFQALSTGDAGVDPYASAVSDVYQDLFREGSFTGKGIYDVRVFATTLKERTPENALLSHDLFEGNYLRCGFLSDVEFFEDFPSHTEVAMARSHRWTRGDWQLLPWIFGRGGRSISVLGRWKMLDNLRRSLLAPACFALIVAALSISDLEPLSWILLAFVGLAISSMISFFVEVLTVFNKPSIRQNLPAAFKDLKLGLHRFVFQLALLPHSTTLSLDAITRALYRLFVSHKKMLEWTTAAQVRSSANNSWRFFLYSYRWDLILIILAFACVQVLNARSMWFASPLLLLWLASPLIARHASLPPKPKLIRPLSYQDVQLLNRTARKIWYFFTTFVTEEDHFLPPDNFQETPAQVVAHRSSPTNFGLYLLSILSARDFGWIGTYETLDRLQQTLQSMDRLPRHDGHFYNWYETKDFRALDPKYISSVDNGNLAGHLLVVAQTCLEILQKPLPILNFAKGALQTLAILEEAVGKIPGSKNIQDNLHEMRRSLIKFDQLVPIKMSRWEGIEVLAEEIMQVLGVRHQHYQTPETLEAITWAKNLLHDVTSTGKDLHQLFSWIDYTHPSLPASFNQHHEWHHIQARLTLDISLQQMPDHYESVIHDLILLRKNIPKEDSGFSEALEKIQTGIESTLKNVQSLHQSLQETTDLCHRLFHEMDFKLLFDHSRKLFSIGYRLADHQLDAGYYDLMASEARLTSFIAIAKGDVSASHWFKLGRGMTPVKNGNALVSWSGSMFEYLMPSLVMQFPEGSLIDRTCHLSVARQIEYGQERQVPWGVSESAYNKRDLHFTYQYSNFGVPDLGLKRGLGADLVVAPYATLLASMYDAYSAVRNLRALQDIGGEGPYGFYEALDFTPSRLQEGLSHAVVKTYMAHHQGMSLVSINNVLKNGLMRSRFHAHPLVQAAELLLQERTPRNITATKPNEKAFSIGRVREEVESVSRLYHNVHRPVPTTQLLSNGNYSLMVTTSGAGYSTYREFAINRWREDVTRDNWGSFIFLKDITSGKIWSATYQPTCLQPETYDVTFFEDRARFHRLDDKINSELEIYLSPEHPAEIRQLTLTNFDTREREIEVTSYFEVVLNRAAADVAHPAFSNLFVQTEYASALNTLVATRRARSAQEQPAWLAHTVTRDRYSKGEIQYETNRMEFIGRGKDVRKPNAIFEDDKLSNTVGAVLDPVMSLRTRVVIPPGVSARIHFTTFAADTREEIFSQAEIFQDINTYHRSADLAWTQAQVKLHYLNMEPDEAHLFQRLATRLLYLDSSLRPSSEMIKRNSKDVTGLWAYGISGDLPIVVIRIDDFEDRNVVRQLIKAHEYLRGKGLSFDLVILNDQPASYSQELQSALEALVHSGRMISHDQAPSKGKIFVLRTDNMPAEDRVLIYATARAALSSRQGSLSEQVKRMRFYVDKFSFSADTTPAHHNPSGPGVRIPPLKFFNGLGGFSEDGSEYVIALRPGLNTPAPWVNVIANAEFGFTVSESGSGYTYSQNSRENQITPWRNDPVSDTPGEAFYILDRDSGSLWTPTPLPIRIEGGCYITRHGHGYTSFEHESHGIVSELTQFVAWDMPVKISILKLRNKSSTTRRLSVSAYVEWVLGFNRALMAPTTVTELDPTTGAIFALNSRSDEYGHKISFATLREPADSLTGDRTEFMGRNGTLEAPGSLYKKEGFSGRIGAGLDPCAAMQRSIDLEPNENIEIAFFLGQTDDRKTAREIILKLRAFDLNLVFDEVCDKWDEILTRVTVETPDESMNLMLNRWLLYQTTVCRFWARAGFYQAGGAYGFRDQLQDVMALMWTQPKVAREHILRAASRQFVEGDVQHWWHPPFGRGVRTHFSDDLLWLPYTVSHYLKTTNDFSILDVPVSFIEGPLLREDQEDSYYTPAVSHNSASLYDHCVRAIDRSLKIGTGAHGLPLIGAGDWNDGMNRVGHEGKGESVWMAWFLYTNLLQFADVAEARGDEEKAIHWRNHAVKLQTAAELEAWDGEWYRRAYYDNGVPIGSASQSECKIDSLSQTWAVISGAAKPERARQAMQAVEKYLIKKDEGMILLFTPPFNKTLLDPGYIKGYLPGVRENGGQYTHAAIWCVIAYAMMGEKEKAAELFALLNPINHGRNTDEVAKYKVEPYVLAADVYSQDPYKGRGGWTWYTGSCGWMYRAGMEYILGFQIQGNEVVLNPCIPASWAEYRIHYRFEDTEYEFIFENPGKKYNGITQASLDGEPLINPRRVRLVNDLGIHRVIVSLGMVERSDIDRRTLDNI